MLRSSTVTEAPSPTAISMAFSPTTPPPMTTTSPEWTPGHAAQQDAGAALRALERMGAGLDRHASGHLRHRGQQREPAALVGDGLVGDAGRAAGDEVAGLVGVGREVEVGEQHLARVAGGPAPRPGAP